MATLSLRSRLLAGMAVVAVVLVAVAGVVTSTTHSYLLRQVDEQLVNLSTRPSELQIAGFRDDARLSPAERPERALSDVFLAVVADGQMTVLATPGLASDTDASPDLTAQEAEQQAATGEPFSVGSTTADGPDYRVLARVDRRSGDTIVIGQPISDVDDAIRRLIGVELAGTLVALLVLSLVTWWVIRLGVRPIKQMTRAASDIAAGDLSGRVPTSDAGTEAGELGDALNQMLARIESAFDDKTASEDRLRRFVADASHELRTPVTTIRGYGELYRHGGLEDPADLAEAMRRTEEESIRMGNLVGDMLLLARLDQGRPLTLEPVRLDQLLHDAARDARAVQPSRTVEVDAAPATAVVDEEKLRQVLANIVSNALVHTGAEAAINLRLELVDGTARISIHDDGPGMSPDHAASAFERFYRADTSRSRRQGGSGLGLAIVKSVTEALGGSVQLHSAPGEGTTVVLTLPDATAGHD